jgi:hypothetical protein
MMPHSGRTGEPAKNRMASPQPSWLSSKEEEQKKGPVEGQAGPAPRVEWSSTKSKSKSNFSKPLRANSRKEQPPTLPFYLVVPRSLCRQGVRTSGRRALRVVRCASSKGEVPVRYPVFTSRRCNQGNERSGPNGQLTRGRNKKLRRLGPERKGGMGWRGRSRETRGGTQLMHESRAQSENSVCLGRDPSFAEVGYPGWAAHRGHLG